MDKELFLYLTRDLIKLIVNDARNYRAVSRTWYWEKEKVIYTMLAKRLGFDLTEAELDTLRISNPRGRAVNIKPQERR